MYLVWLPRVPEGGKGKRFEGEEGETERETERNGRMNALYVSISACTKLKEREGRMKRLRIPDGPGCPILHRLLIKFLHSIYFNSNKSSLSQRRRF